MRPYVIRQGDYLSKLAYKFGFDADTVWAEAKNEPLRQIRTSPNILLPGDIVYIPDPVRNSPATHNLSNGTTNTFVSDPATVTVTLKFGNATFASQSYSVRELPHLTGQTSSADGTVTFAIPVTIHTLTITFTESDETFVFHVGHLDPIGTPSGVFQRLQNLGYIDPDSPFVPSNLDLVRVALRDFQADHGQTSGDAPPRSDPDGGLAPPATSDDAPGSESWVPASTSAPFSSGSTASDDRAPPASGPISSLGSDADPQDDAGLNDDGELDDATSRLLLQAYGC